MSATLFTQFALAVIVREWAAAVAARASWQPTTAAVIRSKRAFRPNIFPLFLSDFTIRIVLHTSPRRACARATCGCIAYARTQSVPAINVVSLTAAVDGRCGLEGEYPCDLRVEPGDTLRDLGLETLSAFLWP